MGVSPCPQHTAAADLQLSVALDCVPVVGEALARAGVSVVAGLTLTGAGEPVPGARVVVTIASSDGPLGDPVELTVDVEPGRTTVFTDLDLRLDPAVLAGVAEPGTATVEARVERDGQLLGCTRTAVRVLASGQWLAAPTPLALELLAAHVQPGSPAVAGLVGAAADLLRLRTGDPTVGGHPTGSARIDGTARLDGTRIDETAAAIVEAMRRRAIRPRPALASWADVPQRVRTPDQVLDDRAGTSLDTVLTLAAALEHAGIRPLLWIAADGATCPGHAFLGYWRVERCAESAATTEVSGLAELVEQGAIALVETTMLGIAAEPATFGDLHRTAAAAWLAGDLHRVLGVTDVHRARLDGVDPLPLPGLPDRRPTGSPTRTGARPTGTAAALLDLDRADGGVVPLTVPPGRLTVLAERLAADAALTLVPTDQLGAAARRRGIRSARDLPPHQLGELLVEHGGLYAELGSVDYARRLAGLADRAAALVEETGTGDLYLALGSVTWELDGRPVRSPLVLVPVLLSRVASTGAYRLTADPAGAIGPNGHLLAELHRRTGVAVPALDDGGDPDLAVVLPALRQELAQRGLPHRVEPTADLAVLPAASARIRQDVDQLGAAALRNPLVPVLLRPGQPFVDPVPAPGSALATDLAELAATLPLPADTDQLQAITDATAGRTFVLEGAPGTGKSQTVANLVAAAAAGGQRVLVLAAQQSALDAVSRRLDGVGLGGLVTGLRRPAAVPPDAGDLPAFAALPAFPDELRTARRELAGYAERLHAPNSAGLSLYAARAGVLSAVPGTPALPLATTFVATASARTTAKVHQLLTTLPEVAARTRPRPRHPWGFLDSADADPVAVHAAVLAVDTALRALPPAGPLARVIAAARTPEDLDAVATVLAGPDVPLAAVDAVRTPEWAEDVAVLLAEISAFVTAAHPGLDVALPEALDLPLAGIAEDAEQAAVSGRFGRAKRLAAVLTELTPSLRPDAHVEPTDVPVLTAELLQVQGAARELTLRCSDVAGLAVPWNWNPLTDPQLVERQVAALRRLGSALDGDPTFTPPMRRFLDTSPAPDPARAVAVRKLRAALTALPVACLGSLDQLVAWAGDTGLVRLWDTTQDERAVEQFGVPSLGHWLDLLRHLHLLEAAGLAEARAALLSGAVPADDAVAAFDRGVAEASFAERSAAGGLGAADARAAEQAVHRALAASAAARTQAAAALAEGDRTRAVLATPDAVARFLPPTAGSFDLVVIEDASSLRVTDALGALGRASAAVVVGDRQQLPPRAAVDEVPDEGLLDACVRAGVPRRELTWHHRSADESLVAFADVAAYGSRLTTVPGPPAGPAISLVQVDGVFLRAGEQRGTNPAEAEAVVAELRQRFAASAESVPSVAVVTLHGPQRRLIEGLLRVGRDRAAEALDRGELRVREVEAAQGEEADVVLLSLGCAADERGCLPLDLGPLNRAGGERRLTVAVSRARRQVVVFASFRLSLLRPVTTTQPGVRRLRTYLEQAVHGTDTVPRRSGAVPDPHREEVAAALRGRGLVVRTDVGLSPFRVDLTVARAEAPARPVLAVLLDGPAWAERAPVDRELAYLELAELRGWPAVERVWLPEWLAEEETVLDRLVAAVAGAAPVAPLLPPLPAPVAEVAEPQEEIDPFDPDAPDVEDEVSTAEPVRCAAHPVVTPALLAGEVPFRAWTPKPVGEPQMLRQLANPEAARLVRRVLAAGIRAEGPIHRERLARLTASAFGVPRVNAARMASILALLPEPGAEFLWPATSDRTPLDPAGWTTFRRQAASTDRALEHVPPEEIGNAMVALCRSVAGMTRDDLFQQTLAVFGHRRRHPVLMPPLELALAQAVRAGRITRQSAGQWLTAVADGDADLHAVPTPPVPPSTVVREHLDQPAAG
ncbi:DUF4011 domain-containing protein [Modestobacter sp. VKM Ac-2979]|uniref:DUF4011 domain-containing protein n=1 Tax=unclassified Modestobacter TaxID=2643866 RepID=UPI0022AB7A01|nr:MULTISPECIES: DUF4011 domain-containing protein [unclassified Modestobacter]MCZ2813874.1 DUF4011 domain-containing protein [Modestobacter sp. VKM Ac-2979]MCZ2844151.1 DUF4011 domain-containing protein [Modestobacter sp. VKM Ac-2980]